ncbi:MAG: pyruvate:ferredoxin (flavodoxin) oxidoreductase, partial [Synergistaceae bacterium]|jgi:pyruvate-ferredoxin/flavodoxin oxidoreductase|nr:pyruvate:ferredoxin (flavodoxin) oxidoreductase [Synergistaceae bacterium]
MDGNTAAAHVAYAFTEVAAIFPITPSSTMPEMIDEWAAHGLKNIFGQTVKVTELQSEGGAAGAVHGALSAGSLASTFTASQGLLLMLPNMYKISGELMPGVFHVSARAVAGHALSIFGDHSDVMSARMTGFAMLASGSVQETMDLSAVSHLAAIRSSIPFLNFFDGFRTSHEVQKIDALEYDDLAKLVDYDAIDAFRDRSMRPENPFHKGTAQNPDVFFQAKEAAAPFYVGIPDTVEAYMREIKKLTGREYHPFNYYGHPEATRVVAAIGSACQAIEETVDHLTARGERVGVVEVHLYRPFSPKYFFRVLPSTVEAIAVLDRCKEPGSLGEPLYEDIRTLFFEKGCAAPKIVGGRYGLGSKDTTPSHIKTVFDNLKLYEPRNNFTVGIVDDVSDTSLPVKEHIVAAPEGTVCCKFWGLGSDGTVGANKNSIKIIGDHTDMYAQGYFAYDSKKSGGITVSHLRFGKSPIKSTYLIDSADFIACHKQEYVHQYNVLAGMKKGGTFLLNTQWTTLDKLEEQLPSKLKRELAAKECKFFVINAVDEAEKLGLGNRTNTIMQSAFFKLANVIPIDDAVKYMKDAIEYSYGKRGEAVVKMNDDAVDAGLKNLIEIKVPAAWVDAADRPVERVGLPSADKIPDFVENVCIPINAQDGDSLPSSAFLGREDGRFPSGTSAYEKRGVAVNVPEWKSDKCIQCNQCAMVCPHAAIRPFLLDAEEQKAAPEGFNAVEPKAKVLKDCAYKYKMQVDVLDCMGCGNCADICPVGALEMKPIATQSAEIPHWTHAIENIADKENAGSKFTIQGSQFQRPLLEFSGACAGCGETPYAKLVTQLFGDRMMIANATGCSSIWGASSPSMPYTVDAKGHGPAWANSLFEDNAEYGYGMKLSINVLVGYIVSAMEALLKLEISEEDKAVLTEWLETRDDGEKSKASAAKVEALLEKGFTCECGCSCRGEGDGEIFSHYAQIYKYRDYLVKKSIWIFGGDGWAYDIGYGGLDHVLGSGEDINVLVVDTEVYSNTGGQSSKATPTAAIAKFAASGKRVRKKDLGRMAMTYGHVYVAQVGMGADKNQLLKALAEAEAHKGPSLVIAYAPCINHGIKAGMGKTQDQTKKAVDAGYWHLYRYNPALFDQGKNPFTLDSKEPKTSFKEFLESEVRYASLKQSFPEIADALFDRAEKEARQRYNAYKALAELGAEPIKAE